MASRWGWAKACLLVALCLSSATGECPDNPVKLAVDYTIIQGNGIAVVRYPVGTRLTLSCLWTFGTASCRGTDIQNRPHVTVNGTTKAADQLCADIVNNGQREIWFTSDVWHTVENASVYYVCSFDGCGTSLRLSIYGGSGPTQVSADPQYCWEHNMVQCRVDTTPSTSTPSHTPATTTTAAAATIPGLNPLIYTLLAVILLGTASIVAMVSCWMRHRRLMQRRREELFGREYLDFMGDNDFTTVTTNQLLASLAEAPPTYQQSEVLEQRLREGEDDSDEETPPPLPPRNTTERRQVAPEPPLAVTAAVGGNSEGGDRAKEDGNVDPIPSDHSEEESYSAKDEDSTALIH